MGLFSPWFLAGLAALGLPLWLHLLRQFKRTPRPFSSLMFFERQIQSSSKHRRLRYLRLLAMRMALLALLALLFANPFIKRASSAVAPRKLTVVAIDRSFSMRFQNRIADAKSQATQFVNGAAGSQAFQVAALDSRLAMLTQPGKDKAAIDDAIGGVDAGDEASSYGEFCRALRVMEQTTGLGLDVHLFTDAQDTSMPAAFTDLKLGPHTSLTIHEIGKGTASNWAVQSVNVPARIYDAANVRLTTTVAGWQTKDATRKVSVLLDGRSVATKDIAIPVAGSAELEFNDLVIPYGAHRGEVRMEPHDDLPNDDSFLFSIERSDPRKVLFLHGIGRAADSFFYKSAMDASAATGLRVQPAPLEDLPQYDLSQYAFVVLNNPGELDERTTRALSDYVAKGGAVLVGVGLATERAGVIPLAGEGVSGTTTAQGAGTVETKASEIFDPEAFSNVQFLATPRIAAKPADRVMARFADGSPLLMEQKQGEGRVMILASTLDNSTSDFPVHASFLPFVAATGAYLSGARDDGSSLAVGSAVTLRQSKSQSASADVIGPDGKHEIALSDATRIMTFNPEREGFYDVHRANGARLLLAVHADRRESNLAKVPEETLNLWRNTNNSGGAANTEAGPETATVPFSLWRYILTLVLIAAIVESVFATRYLSGERQAT